MRLIDADMLIRQLTRIKSDAKLKKRASALYDKMISILNDTPTANQTCFNCGTVLAGEIRERQETDTETN